jgi:hypothetical protein
MAPWIGASHGSLFRITRYVVAANFLKDFHIIIITDRVVFPVFLTLVSCDFIHFSRRNDYSIEYK